MMLSCADVGPTFIFPTLSQKPEIMGRRRVGQAIDGRAGELHQRVARRLELPHAAARVAVVVDHARLGLLVGGLLIPLSTQFDISQAREAQRQIEAAREALVEDVTVENSDRHASRQFADYVFLNFDHSTALIFSTPFYSG